MLTNPEMLAVNQHSSNNRQVSRTKDLIVWAADAPGGRDKYVALFNAQSKGDLDFTSADYASPVIAGQGNSQDITVSVKGGKRLVLFVREGGDGNHFDHAVWENPVLRGPKGELKLIDLKWSHADAGWGEVRVNRTCDNQPLRVGGKEVSGIGTHANSTIIYDLPEGYETFSTRGVMSRNGSVVFGVLVDKGEQVISDVSEVTVDFQAIGLSGQVRVRDLWEHKDLGVFSDAFGQKLPMHGAGLYRLSPVN